MEFFKPLKKLLDERANVRRNERADKIFILSRIFLLDFFYLEFFKPLKKLLDERANVMRNERAN